jgi:hypothetical protein
MAAEGKEKSLWVNLVRGCLSVAGVALRFSFCFFSGAAAGWVRNAMRFLCRAAEKQKAVLRRCSAINRQPLTGFETPNEAAEVLIPHGR